MTNAIAFDRTVECIRCHYDLRGLADDARCPECGLPLYWTLRAPENLSQYPATWVTTMSRAVRLLMIAYAGVFFLFVGESVEVLPRSEDLLLTVLALAAALQLIGAWMLSRSSGHWSEPAAPINRWILRLSPIGLVLSAAAAIWVNWDYSELLMTLVAAGAIAGLPTPTALFIRLRTVARMIADPHLAEHSIIVGWGFVGSIALCGIMALLQSQHRQLPLWLGLTLAMAIGVSALLFLLWGAFIFFSCMVDFGRAAKVARAQWNAAAAPV